MPTRIIVVRYCSNYNGCYITGTDLDGNGVDLDPFLVEKCVNEIVEKAVTECSDDGLFYGDIDVLEEFIIATIESVFGADAPIMFEEDSFST